MNSVNPPALYGEPIGTALFKSRPEDFQVDEILGFELSGEGEHCMVWIEKTNRNSNEVATELAKKLGIRKRLVSHCGMKDRNAITRQWFSIHLPGKESPSAADLDGDGIRALKITRSLRKPRRGCHFGNHFMIRLRDCTFSKQASELRWQQIIDHGAPNYFGPQRFGRNGDNVEHAIQFMSGNVAVKDRALRGILISAARSQIFNDCVAQRIENDTWNNPMEGEVFGFSDNRSLVLPDNLRGDEVERVHAGKLELTAPLWGDGMLQSQGQVRAFEESVAARSPAIISGLAQFNLRQERRVIRVKPLASELTWETNNTLVLQFDLPSGMYATTLLREFIYLHGNQGDVEPLDD